MIRLRRWLFNIFAFISLLVCIATTGMWVRSHFASDRLAWPNLNFRPPSTQSTILYGEGHVDFRPSRQFSGPLVVFGNRVINSGLGVVEFVIDSLPRRQIQPFHASLGLPPQHFVDADAASGRRAISSRTATLNWSLLGFSYDELSGYYEDSILAMPGDPKTVFVKRWTIPYWPLSLVSAIIPFVWTRSTFRKRRRPTQGYCATCGYDLRATPERCPECGTATAAEAMR